MIDHSLSGPMELYAVFAHLSLQETAIIGVLLASLVSLLIAWVLLRKRLKTASVEPVASGRESTEVDTQALRDVMKAQVELRELVREFSTLAELVLQASSHDRPIARLPHTGGAALQLVDLGLTPIEAARVTEMTVGEVALLMNLRKAKSSRCGVSDVPSLKTEDSAVPVRVAAGAGGGDRE